MKCDLGTYLDKDACKKYKLLWFSDQVDAWKWSLVSINGDFFCYSELEFKFKY